MTKKKKTKEMGKWGKKDTLFMTENSKNHTLFMTESSKNHTLFMTGGLKRLGLKRFSLKIKIVKHVISCDRKLLTSNL